MYIKPLNYFADRGVEIYNSFFLKNKTKNGEKIKNNHILV